MAQPILKTIPLSELRISKLNMRHSRKKPDVSDILPSIRESGIRQTLLVRKEGDHYGVVAGRRRYFALKEIEKETGETALVPCAIMAEENAASAIAASVIENVGRLPASEMEQYTAFKRLHDEGRSMDEIAAFFGVTELRLGLDYSSFDGSSSIGSPIMDRSRSRWSVISSTIGNSSIIMYASFEPPIISRINGP